MIKDITALFLGVTLVQFCFGQETIILNSPESGNQIHVASNEISFQSGYSYVPNTGNSLHAYIDENANTYSDFFSEITFDRAINTDAYIGVTKGDFDVNNNGAVTYSIPIDATFGISGLTPHLNLRYNHLGRNSEFGLGWSLDGLSKISRVNKSIYYDDEVAPIRFNETDALVLDGIRLIEKEGEGINIGTKYVKEANDFSLIECKNNPESGYKYFEIRSRDGKIYFYGLTDDSRKKTSSGDVIEWKLSKIEDRNSNYIKFEYEVIFGSHVISKIEYAGNENLSLASSAIINFNYSERQDKKEYFIKGEKNTNGALVKSISLSYDDEEYKKYHFKYGHDISSKLIELKESGKEAKFKNSTIFKYNDSSKNTDIRQLNREGLPLSSLGKNMVFYPGDFNGDGRSDFLALRYTFDSDGKARYISWGIYYNQGKEDGHNWGYSPLPYSSVYIGNDGGYSEFNSGSNFPVTGFRFLIGDLNGDGKDDIVVGSQGKYDNIDAFHEDFVYYSAYLSDASSFFVTNFTRSSTLLKLDNYDRLRWGGRDQYRHTGTLADIDGDGRSEFVAMNTWNKRFYVNSFDGRVSIVKSLNEEIKDIRNPNLSMTDYDGDGDAELVFTYLQNLYFWVQPIDISLKNYTSLTVNTGPTYLYSDLGVDILGREYSSSPSFSQMDFNGDGKLDLLLKKNDFLELWQSKGFVEGQPFNKNSYDIFNIPTELAGSNTFYIDLNSDNLTDVVKVTNTQVIYYINKGFETEFIKYSKSHGITIDGSSTFSFGDYNSDGIFDLIVKNNRWCCIDILNLGIDEAPMDNFISSFKDGFNNEINVTYSDLGKDDIYSVRNYSYPLAHFGSKYWVASSVGIPDGLGGENYKHFKYAGAAFHKLGKGFVGFSEFTIDNHSTQREVKRIFEVEPTYFFNQLIEEEVRESQTGSQWLFNSHFINNSISTGGKSFFTYLENSKKYFSINGSLTEENFSYSTSGLLLENTKKVDNLDHSITTFTYQTVFSELGDTHIKSKNEWRKRTGETEIERDFSYSFNDKGSLTSIISDQGTPYQVEKELMYDSFGNTIEEKVISSSSDIVKESRKTYSDDKRFIISETNSLNQVENYLRDPVYGNIEEVEYNSGLKSIFTYDEFGVKTSEIDPLGITTKIKKQWDINLTDSPSLTNPNTLYKTISKTASAPEEIVFYDNLLREVKKVSENKTGEIIQLFEFDRKGNKISETAPFFSDDSDYLITKFEYDPRFNRLIKESTPFKTMSYDYAFHDGGKKVTKTTVTDNLGRSGTSVIDATGKMIKSIDEGGEIKHYYYSNGQKKFTTINGVEVLRFEYDELGRKTKMIEPNSGETNYEYDGFGNLTKQTYNNGDWVGFEYDAMDKLLKKSFNEGSIEFQYGITGSSINQLVKIINYNGDQTDLSYDDKGRIVEKKENISGEEFWKKFAYSSSNKLVQEEFSTGVTLNIEYDDFGNIEKMTDNQSLILFKQDELTPYNDVKASTILSDNYFSREFNKQGLVVKEKYGTNWEFEYKYDNSTGNLKERHNNKTSISDYYTFDDLDRLTSYYSIDNTLGTSSELIEMDYSSNGNILSKSDVGNYSYDNDKINAVKQITDDDGNSIVSKSKQITSYYSFDRLKELSQENLKIQIEYGPDLKIRKEIFFEDDLPVFSRIETMGMEKGSGEIDYNKTTIRLPDGNLIIKLQESGSSEINTFVGVNDFKGTLSYIHSNDLTETYYQDYDPWGREKVYGSIDYGLNPKKRWSNENYSGNTSYNDFQSINFKNRVFDPSIARFYSVDNYIYDVNSTQAYNRYSYSLNNPLKFVDPDGENPVVIAMVVGGVLGSYSGYRIAESYGYNFSDWQTYGFMLGGAAIGVGSGYAGATIAAGNMAMANTIGIVYSSVASSIGMAALSGGTTPVNISFGVASYDLTNRKFNYLFKKENKWYQDLSYGFGLLANVQDLAAGFNGGEISVNSAKFLGKDPYTGGKIEWWGHSSITNKAKTIDISVGPKHGASGGLGAFKIIDGKIWSNYAGDKGTWNFKLNNVNSKLLEKMTTNIKNYNNMLLGGGNLKWNLVGFSCVNYTSRALWAVGIPTLPVNFLHPVMLNLQLSVRQIGISANPYINE